MPILHLYDKLLQFSLFQGMSRDDLELVAGHTRFGFTKIERGKGLVRDGDPCHNMCFLINGQLEMETVAVDHSYSVTERIAAPNLLQPEAIFGLNQRYTHTFTALTDANFITVDKDEVMHLAEDFLVFRINLLNLFATTAQKSLLQPWRHCPRTLDDRIIRFFAQHCLYPAGHKTFRILMTRLADELNDSRLDVSRALNRLEDSGKIVLHRGRIEIPSMEALLM